MTRQSSERATLTTALALKRRSRIRLAALAAATAAVVAVHAVQAEASDLPRSSSRARKRKIRQTTGLSWVDNILEEGYHHDIFHDYMGMNRSVFQRLLQELEPYLPSDRIPAREQLAIFLYIVTSGCSLKRATNRFQRSLESISVSFYTVVESIVSTDFYDSYLSLPRADGKDRHLSSNPKLWPHFKNCLGVIDGVQVPAHVTGDDLLRRSRNGSGETSQNVIACCNFNMAFTYALTGGEGCGSDTFIFNKACRLGLAATPGRYWLGDSQLPSCDIVLTPYLETPYTLYWEGSSHLRPQNHKELFNLRHAQARIAFYRTFNAVKSRFNLRVLTQPNEHTLRQQAKVLQALFVLHNYIRTYDPNDFPNTDMDSFPPSSSYQSNNCNSPMDDGLISPLEQERSHALRDSIAMSMWITYQVDTDFE